MVRASDQRLAKVLHVALALLIAVEGAFNLAHGLSAQRDPQLIAFGAAETLGAVLLAWSRTIAIGGCVLVCTFLIAAAVHLFGHDFPSEHLVYAVAVLFVIAHYREPAGSEHRAA